MTGVKRHRLVYTLYCWLWLQLLAIELMGAEANARRALLEKWARANTFLLLCRQHFHFGRCLRCSWRGLLLFAWLASVGTCQFAIRKIWLASRSRIFCRLEHDRWRSTSHGLLDPRAAEFHRLGHCMASQSVEVLLRLVHRPHVLWPSPMCLSNWFLCPIAGLTITLWYTCITRRSVLLLREFQAIDFLGNWVELSLIN